MEAFGEAYKLVADGPYCEIHFFDGSKKVVTKTLQCVMFLCPDIFLRINRKIAVNTNSIKTTEGNIFTTTKGDVIKMSRRRYKQFNQNQ